MLLKTFKYPLRPLAEQRRTFERWRGLCCDLYNAGLEQRRTWHRKAGKSLALYDQFRQLAELRSDETEFAALPSDIARSPLRHLDRSYQASYRRIKAGEKAGFPRFKSRERYSTIGIGRRKIKRDTADPRNAWVSLPDRTWVRFKMTREIVGEVRDTSITRDARGRWFVCFSCDVGEAPPKRPVVRTTGIDLGLTTFAVLADGSEIANPQHFRRSEASLARAQRLLARKTKGSNSRRKAKVAVARVHERVANQRRDFHVKAARDLVQRYDVIAVENLNVAGLAKSSMAKSVSDVGWGQFLRILACKAEEAGAQVIAVDPRNTTQACSSCGEIVPKGLSDRVHSCPCGLTLGRDHNAALNIQARGLRAVPRCEAGPEPPKAEPDVSGHADPGAR